MDGGTSSDASDATNWLRMQEQWNVLAYEPLKRNCKKARTILETLSTRVHVRCSALSDSSGLAEFVDEEELGDMWGSLRVGSGVGKNTRNAETKHLVHVNVTTLDTDAEAGWGKMFVNGVYLLKRVPSKHPVSFVVCLFA